MPLQYPFTFFCLRYLNTINWGNITDRVTLIIDWGNFDSQGNFDKDWGNFDDAKKVLVFT